MIDNESPKDVLKKVNQYLYEEEDSDRYAVPATGRRPSSSVNLMNIPVSDIDPSLVNNDERSMRDYDLQILADSIREFGLKEPIRVYENSIGSVYKYTIISGHRRLAAYMMLIRQKYFVSGATIPCIIAKKPEDEILEKIDIAQSNISRRDPKDLVKEVSIANDIWESIIVAGRQDEFIPKLKESFRKQNEDNEKYQADPEKFERYYYRSRMEFIRAVTGLSVTNKTVQTAIQRAVNENNDSEGQFEKEPEVEKKREPKLVKSQINNNFYTLIDNLTIYCNQAEDVPEEVKDFISTLVNFRDTYFNVKRRRRGRKKGY